MTLPTVCIFSVVPPPMFSARCGIHGLTVDTGRRSRTVRLLFRSDFAAEPVMDRLKRAVVTPFVEVTPHGTTGRKVFRKVPPLAPRTEQVKDGVDHVAEISDAGPAARINRNQW